MKTYINTVVILVITLIIMVIVKLFNDDMEARLPKLVAIEVANKINTDYINSEIKYHEDWIYDNDSIYNDCIEDAIDITDLYYYQEQFDSAIVKGDDSLKLHYFQEFSKESNKLRDYEADYLDSKVKSIDNKPYTIDTTK